jgi:pseudaminic acid synthase
MSLINIAGRTIGAGQPPYVIAEISANHDQEFDKAVRLVHEAKQAGADAVKFQTYTPDTLTIDCDTDCFRIGPGTLWAGQNLYALYGQAYTPWEWQPRLKEVADELGIHCFSTPFDHTAVRFLEEMNVPAHKIASFELVDLRLLRQVGATGKPILVSTGMAELDEIAEAVSTLRKAGAEQIALLRCSSAYPAPPEAMNLATIPHLSEAFNVPVGLSDHTLGTAVPVAAVALGACIIEKHLTLSRQDPGPDSAFSLEPHEFRAMVDAVHTAHQSLGKVQYGPSEAEAKSRQFRRSLFVVRDVAAGEVFSHDNIRSIRPSDGLPPKHLDEVVGRRASATIKRGTPLAWRHVA